MILTTIVGLLAAASFAHPTRDISTLRNKYQLVFTTDGTGPDACYHAARLFNNGTYGTIIIADTAIPLRSTQGNLITINSTKSINSGDNLLFHEPLPGYAPIGGASVFYPNLSPSSPAMASSVIVSKGYPGDAGWVISQEQNSNDIGIFHNLHAGSQGLFACNGTIEGKTVSVLSFGKYGGNLEFPAGCQGTQVVGYVV